MSRVSKELMAVSKCCSFGPTVGFDCLFDRRDAKRSTEIIPVTVCEKEISNHKSTWAFPGIANEQELILVQAGIFYASLQVLAALKICPFHLSELGIS